MDDEAAIFPRRDADRIADRGCVADPPRFGAALTQLRRGDAEPMARLLAARASIEENDALAALGEGPDESLALLCRAAGLPWDEFEAVMTQRAALFQRQPRTVSAALRLFRDTNAAAARVRLARPGLAPDASV
jgi:hypothetical protein